MVVVVVWGRSVLGWEEEREEKFADACELAVAVAVAVASNRSLWCGGWKGGEERQDDEAEEEIDVGLMFRRG